VFHHACKLDFECIVSKLKDPPTPTPSASLCRAASSLRKDAAHHETSRSRSGAIILCQRVTRSWVTHLERITDGIRNFEFIIWIDNKCARELLGSARKLGKDQDPRVFPGDKAMSRSIRARSSTSRVTQRRGRDRV
jgi:hypothetical protein